MSLTATTLSVALGAGDVSVSLAATTGLVVPSFPTGPTCFILVENELMTVDSWSGVSGANPGVSRGTNGTKAVAHASSSPALIFTSADLYGSLYNLGLIQQSLDSSINNVVGSPVVSATTIAPPIWGPGTSFHVTGTTALSIITLPAGVMATEITLIMDGSGSGLTWGAGGNISVAGTATTAASAVTFFYDAPSSKWIPSRLA